MQVNALELPPLYREGSHREPKPHTVKHIDTAGSSRWKAAHPNSPAIHLATLNYFNMFAEALCKPLQPFSLCQPYTLSQIPPVMQIGHLHSYLRGTSLPLPQSVSDSCPDGPPLPHRKLRPPLFVQHKAENPPICTDSQGFRCFTDTPGQQGLATQAQQALCERLLNLVAVEAICAAGGNKLQQCVGDSGSLYCVIACIHTCNGASRLQGWRSGLNQQPNFEAPVLHSTREMEAEANKVDTHICSGVRWGCIHAPTFGA